MVGGVASPQIELLIIVGQGLSELSVGAVVYDAERDGIEWLAYERLHEGLLLGGGEIAQDFVALARDVDWNLIRHGGGWSARARGVGEDVQISEGQVFNQAPRGFEFGVGLAGKSHQDVGANSGSGHGGANLFNLLAIMPGTIFAMHAPQNRVTAGLQRHMRMLGDTRR